MNFSKASPCASCPFRSDIRQFITAGRVREIERGLVRGVFPCHKTLDYSAERDCDDEGGTGPAETENTQHCAGALILLEKLDRPGQMMRIAERLRLYDRTKLKMDAPVYGSFDEMAEAAEMSRA